MGVENNGISFGKNQKINFENFNGIHKDDFNNINGTLKDSLFTKYDKNDDGILDEGELSAMQGDIQGYAKNDKLSKRETRKFFKSLGLENQKDLKRDDLYKFLQTVQLDKDSIAKASTDSATGNTFIEFKPNENNEIKRIVYSNEKGGGHKTKAEQTLYDENHVSSTFYKEDGKVENYEVKGNMQFRTLYNQDGKPELYQETNTQTKESITTKYAQDGKTVESKYRTNGTVTEYLDSANGDRVTSRVTDKGNNVTETIQFTYNEDGSVRETTLGADGKPVSSVTKKDGKELAKSSITTAEDGSTTEISTIGEGDNLQRIKIQKDKDGNVTTRVNIDENGNMTAYKHKVNDGENWYGIVEAKYGVSGYKTVMEIVHQLKRDAGVNRNSSKMPDEIELPPAIKLKNGKEITLKDIDAKFDEINSVAAKIDVSNIKVPENLPTAYPKDKLPAQKITIPTYEVKPENAGKKITQPDGKIFEYNDNGRVRNIYNSEADLKPNTPAITLIYDDSGNISEYQLNDYDANGAWLGAKVYDKAGQLTEISVIEGGDPKYKYKDKYERCILYNPDGSVQCFYDNNVYDENGRCVSYDIFYPDDKGGFEFTWHYECKYSNDGKQERTACYDANGRYDGDL